MTAPTGQTIVDYILSLDTSNNPISAATFDIVTLKDGNLYTGFTPTTLLIDGSRAIFSMSWSASVIGDYQFYVKNNTTTNTNITNVVSILPDSSFDQNIFIGF